MANPTETFTDGLSTLYIACREVEEKERAEGLILHFYPQKLGTSATIHVSTAYK